MRRLNGVVMNYLEETSIQCPYCGESIGILIDASMEFQEYIEDCQVCCRPITLRVAVAGEGRLDVQVVRDDD